MVTLLIGRAGTGKSRAVIDRMAAAHRERRQILIVPEQYSHRAERRVCSVGGNSLSLGSEVLTFTRLATRVFSVAGGLAAPTLDNGGRLLVMYLAVKEMSEALSVYRRPSRKPAFLTGLLATLDECKSYQTSPEALAEAGGRLGGATGDKLRDLGLIFTAYDRLCGQLGADPRDKLTRLAAALKESRWAEGMDVYLDGFTDFTPQQELVIQALMEQAHGVTIALTCDHLEEDEEGLGIFSPARRTAAGLKRLAKDAGQTWQVETCVPPDWETVPLGLWEDSGKDPSLYHLEANLFAGEPTVWDSPSGVTCAVPGDPRREVEWVCAQILKLVREKGWRFREIAVTARTLEGYEALIDDTFPRFGIPVFLARTQDILEKPALSLITSALAAVSGGYRYEDMFRYLKTGLAGVADDDRDRLENYVLTWDIKGSRWTADKPWHMHPVGYGKDFTEDDEARVAELDALRRRVISPLERLRTAPGATGKDRAEALYAFLEEIRLPETLEERVEALTQRGELNLAEEYRQLWDILAGALETCARLLRDVEMDMDEFAKLFALTLSQYQVGTIPVALDRVTAGPCPRLGYESYKALFFLGCDDKSLPQRVPSPGLLTDDDRLALERLGLTLAPRMEDKLCREMTIAYNACTLPTQRLFVTYPAGGEEEQRGSFLFHRLTALFPGALATAEEEPRLAAPGPALELAMEREEVKEALAALPEMKDALERIGRGSRGGRGALSRTGVAALYGRRVPMSASRLDNYRSCHFSYFMKYGLDARPRKRAEFAGLEYGSFVHAVLEEVLKNWNKAMSREETRTLVRRAMDRYLEEKLGGLEDKTPRFAYLFRRLGAAVERVADNVTQELRASQFRPMAFELGFGLDKELPPIELETDGVKVSVSGAVDRVDGWEHDGKLYLRVVDYKTGPKSFDLTDIFHGIGLQMLLYLFTLEREGKAYFGKNIVGAGVLYIPARDEPVDGSRDMDETARRLAADSALKRKGLLLDQADVLAAMAGDPEDMKRFLPVKLGKDGAFAGEGLASGEQLGRLNAHVKRVLEEVGRELAAGTVAADPYWRGPEDNACRWCPFRAACQFEEGKGGDRRRWSHRMSAEDFWEALKGGEGDGIPADR